MNELNVANQRPYPAGTPAARDAAARTPTAWAAGDHARPAAPPRIDRIPANRGFLDRAVRWLASQRNIRQFLDLGGGGPDQWSTHEIAGSVRADRRVVYVHSDPRLSATAVPGLAGVEGVALIYADILDPLAVLSHPQTRQLIDVNEPVGVLVVADPGVASHATGGRGPVARYVAALPSGSYVALSTLTSGPQEESWPLALRRGQARGYESFARTRAEVERFFVDGEGSALACAAVARKL